ncbi:MAG: 30S ribosomal protein S3 [Gammaproteobacteria bacterium]|nr:30S ribosomal protein S3 [Gammaproteobacteria bacterium]MCP4473855.1 30S ribosomal protein S3 [Gammaproteobacteria bacterium]
MGQKVHPHVIRLGINKTWSSRWFPKKGEFAEKLGQDIILREFLHKRLEQAGISHVDIERPARDAKVTIYAARPGIIIGKSGREIEQLRQEASKKIGVPVHINIEEIRKPEIVAALVAESIAQQLVKRISFRRAMKRAMASTLRAGAQGIKVCISGRLGGAEIARSEWSRQGRVPLHTFRADIDYGFTEAKTAYGIIGVKVWIYKGDAIGYQNGGGIATKEKNRANKKQSSAKKNRGVEGHATTQE